MKYDEEKKIINKILILTISLTHRLRLQHGKSCEEFPI